MPPGYAPGLFHDIRHGLQNGVLEFRQDAAFLVSIIG
jgi:hypothetical protein